MNVGDIVFQKLSFDLKSFAIALHELMRFRRPRFCHMGVYIGEGKMIAATWDAVKLQDAGAADCIFVPYTWANFDVSKAWLQSQMGRRYDWPAWVIAAFSPLFLGLNRLQTTDLAYTCSSLVGQAVKRDGNGALVLGERVVTPDDIARVLGVI